jgi:hypothetical protein
VNAAVSLRHLLERSGSYPAIAAAAAAGRLQNLVSPLLVEHVGVVCMAAWKRLLERTSQRSPR